MEKTIGEDIRAIDQHWIGLEQMHGDDPNQIYIAEYLMIDGCYPIPSQD